MRASEVASRLAADPAGVAKHLLPNGRRDGREWVVGSVTGEAGDSLKVCISGSKAGVWCDFATGQSGDLLDLWREVRGVSLVTAIAEAKAYAKVFDRKPERPKKSYSSPNRDGITKLPPQAGEWLSVTRKISEHTAKAFKLAFRNGALMFPYIRDGALISAKYRRIPSKEFYVDADCEPCLFGWQAFPTNSRVCVICEGELDALAFYEFGINALSVPFGGGDGEKQGKWIESEFDRLAVFDQIFLALDNDGPGVEATNEIIKRLGRERCRVVILPHKDANECLIQGVTRETMIQCLVDAKTQDPEELKDASEFSKELEAEFINAELGEIGIRMPWKKVGDRFILRPGEVSVWAGINGHGKSETIGNVVVSALADGWPACVASLEFRPVKWLKRLVRQATATATPSPAYVRHVSQWFREKLWAFDVERGAKSAKILEVFEYGARRYGIKFFIIDNLAKCGFAEDDFNGQKGFVDALTDLAKRYDVHVSLVHHMRKTDSEEKPGGKMDLKGSGGITDMADSVVLVWRNKPKEKEISKLKGATPPPHITDDPDAIVQVCKQRNGEHEPTITLWFDRGSHQYLSKSTYKPRPFVGFSVVANDESVPL